MASPRQWYSVDTHGVQTPTTLPPHFQITTPPRTDIWRPSPTEDTFNAPYIYTPLPSAHFKRLAVTVSAPWKTLYDQGGLLLVWPAQQQQKNKWVKIGLEHFTGKPLLGVVGCDRFADWSVCPAGAGATQATVEAERVGTTLWVYAVVEGGERRPLREIKWAFLEEREAAAEMWVGVYAAKPTPEEGDGDGEVGIEVTFRDLELETAS